MAKLLNSSSNFDRAYSTLNKAQKKAVDNIDGPVMVIAGPGTGKTTILTLRIANILRLTDTAPDSILALTFTESGAYTMRRKLVETIGPRAYKVAIHTFHGFASSVIRHYPDYFERIIGSTLITETEQIQIIEKIITSKKIEILRPFGDPIYYVSPILREIHVLKRENVSPQEFIESIKSEELPEEGLSASVKEKLTKRTLKNTELAFVYKQYEETLAKNKKYDFDDMLLEIIRALEKNPEFKLILQEQYQYILADEHQDANAAQNRILELLSDFHESPNLFIVGDDKQAIYRFQGASLENFLYFSKKYPKAISINLEHNYRSHQKILDASHSLIVNNPTIPGRSHAQLKSLRLGGNSIQVVECLTDNDELEWVVGSIAERIYKGELPHEIAVLYRDNKHAEAIAQRLKAHGIPHRIESDHNIMNDSDVVKICTLCRAIYDPSDDFRVAAALFIKELGADPAEVFAICAQANRERKPLHKLIKKSTKNDFASVRRAYNKIIEWSAESRFLLFPVFLQKLIQDTGIIKSILTAKDSLDRLNSVQTLYENILLAAESKKYYLPDFIEQLNLTEDHGISTRRSYADNIPGVRLMTAHRAKGQEFNHVFIIHTLDGIWGNRSSRNLFNIPRIEHARVTGHIDDERRLFYVALTRARESVTMSYPGRMLNKDVIPSQFIAEINQALIQPEKKEPYNLLTHMSSLFIPQTENITDISILNQSFVRSKFLDQPLSVTHLNNYLQCAWRYFFVNLIRIPQVENKRQLYGTAIHSALRTFFDEYIKTKNTANNLVNLFIKAFEKLPHTADDREDSIEKGTKALMGYHKTYYKQWNQNVVTEYAINGMEVKLNPKDVLKLSGKLDKIEILDKNNVVVVDYKTGKPKSRNHIEGKVKGEKNGEGNYFRQIVFYKILLDADDHYSMKYGEIDFIEPNERGMHKKERFEVGGEDIKKVMKEITSMAESIMNLSFINSFCDDKNCEYCLLAKMIRQA